MPKQDETTKVNELKYEGLTSLIIQGQKNEKERHVAFKEFVNHRFNEIDAHNEKQNGNIATAMKNIAELEKESDRRELTCMPVVAELKKRTKYTKSVAWINNHQRRSAILAFSSVVGIWVLLFEAYNNQWLMQIWELIKTIKG